MDNEQIAEILNDLVQINNDRIAGYENAITRLDKGYDNLAELFNGMINDSKVYALELSEQVSKLRVEVADGTSGAGKIYRAWMDIKALFTGGDARPILSACETIEVAAQKAYDEALSQEGLQGDIYLLLSKQKNSLMESFDHIKQLLAISLDQ